MNPVWGGKSSEEKTVREGVDSTRDKSREETQGPRRPITTTPRCSHLQRIAGS